MSDSDLIKRSDAIEAIEMVDWYHQSSRNKDMVNGANPDEHQAWYKADDIYKALEAVPSADRPQGWIPCSERLPNENGDYLVTLENGVVKILGYSTTQRTTYPKGFYHIKDGFSWRQMQNPVVAWMPLPEPWKGADDE